MRWMSITPCGLISHLLKRIILLIPFHHCHPLPYHILSHYPFSHLLVLVALSLMKAVQQHLLHALLHCCWVVVVKLLSSGHCWHQPSSLLVAWLWIWVECVGMCAWWETVSGCVQVWLTMCIVTVLLVPSCPFCPLWWSMSLCGKVSRLAFLGLLRVRRSKRLVPMGYLDTNRGYIALQCLSEH